MQNVDRINSSLKGVAWVEDAHVIFLYFCLYFFPMNQTNVWKSKKINKHSIFQLVKLHPANLVFNNAIHKLSKIQFWKKLFAIGFPNKHCNLTALPTLQVGVENRDKAYSISHRELWRRQYKAPFIRSWVLEAILSAHSEATFIKCQLK